MSKIFSLDNSKININHHVTSCLSFRELNQKKIFDEFLISQTNLAMFTIVQCCSSAILFYLSFVTFMYNQSTLTFTSLLISVVFGQFVGILTNILKVFDSQNKSSDIRSLNLKKAINILDSIWILGCHIAVTLHIICKAHNGMCSEGDPVDFYHTTGCLYEMPHKMPEFFMTVAMIQSVVTSLIVKGKWEIIIFSFVYNIASLLFTMFYFDLSDSIYYFMFFFPFCSAILYEYQRQNISLFLLTQSQKNLLEENERLAAETHANELRHMIGNVAHDLKTPLSAFINGVELILGILDEVESIQERTSSFSTSLKAMLANVKETVFNMKNVNEFMLMTINRCIDYTKASNGLKLVPRLETVSLSEVINLPLSCMRNMDNRIAIKMTPISEDVASHIITDKQWLQENILCLLSNAVKYSAGGEVNVSVSLSADVKFLLVEIEDTGIGIAEEIRANLFNQFKQAQRLAGGTGLGLYSLAKRVEALGGTYGVSARKDGKQGSLFFFTIPYRPDLSATVGNMLLASQQVSRIDMVVKIDELSLSERTLGKNLNKTLATSTSDMNRRRLSTAEVSMFNTPRDTSEKLNILLVDDSLSIIKMSSMMLRRQGHTVTTADNGAVALRILTEQMTQNNIDNSSSSTVLFDVVLMDLQMPIMDGLEATSRLRKEESLIKSSSGRSHHQIIIGVSACSDFETMEAAFAAGIDAFIPKPFNMQSFNDTYSSLVGSKLTNVDSELGALIY